MTAPTPHDITSAEKVVADHERIWLQNAVDGEASGEGRMWCQDKVWPVDENDGEPTEYVRADIHAAALALIESQRATIEKRDLDFAIVNGLRRAAEARVTALEAEKAGAIKLADGYGVILMMIAAGCSDPQRFAKRMLAEYEAEAKKMEATK